MRTLVSVLTGALYGMWAGPMVTTGKISVALATVIGMVVIGVVVFATRGMEDE